MHAPPNVQYERTRDPENPLTQQDPNKQSKNPSTKQYRTAASTGLQEISTKFLLPLDSLEQRLEVSGTETREVVPLDDFNENRGSVHEVLWKVSVIAHFMRYAASYLCKKLEEVSTLIKIDQDVQTPEHFEVLVETHARAL